MIEIFSHVMSIVRESLHGGAWQAISFCFRIAFLILVLPFLPEGELATYILITSLAVIIARIILLGLDDELPLLVHGSIDRAQLVFPGTYIGWGALVILFPVGLLTEAPLLHATLVGISGAVGLYLGGLIRTISPSDFERLQNAPWIVFGAFALTGWFSTAAELALLRVFSGVVANLVVAARLKLFTSPSLAGMKVVRHHLISGLGASWRKLLSNLSLVATMRGFVLWPYLLLVSIALDPIAFAVACGETIWQFGMIFVHRRYAYFASTEKSAISGRHGVLSAAVLMISLSSAVALAVYIATLLEIFPQTQSGMIVAQAGVFYAALCGFCLIRFLFWSVRQYEWTIIGIQLAFLSLQGFVVAFLPPSVWFPVGTLILLAGLAILFYLSMRASQSVWTTENFAPK